MEQPSVGALKVWRRRQFKAAQRAKVEAQAAAVKVVTGVELDKATPAQAKRELERLKAELRALREARAEYMAEVGSGSFVFERRIAYLQLAIAHIMVGLATGEYTGSTRPDFGKAN